MIFMHFTEYIVLIPLQKTSTTTIVSIERRNIDNVTDKNILHIGSGPNIDFLVYKNCPLSKFF